MLNFKIVPDPETGEQVLHTPLWGKPLLTIPQLNKGTSFTQEERLIFGLIGKLPSRVETLEEQVNRARMQFHSYSSQLQQNIYLNNLHDKNQIVFYKLISKHLAEMLPTIYTPIVGTAVKRFSHEFRQPRGLYISHKDKSFIDTIIENRTNPDIDLIVVTDGEGVLGIGDQGIGGMDIPVAKLMVYSLCGGINPTRTLPIFLDVGTNNQSLLDDPLYLGLRQPRINPQEYDAFIELFVNRVQHFFPKAFLHWEDFGRGNARRILDNYQDKLCTFNDDIQGTGAVTLSALLAACEVADTPLIEHRIVVQGAGSAGTGISEQIVDAMMQLGLSAEQARARFWLVDRQGLLLDNDAELTTAQKPFARAAKEVCAWRTFDKSRISLTDTVRHVQPTILIGCSAQTGAFSQDLIETMAKHCKRPIVFPLSNPDDCCEATPENILYWSQGKALIATGTPFADVEYHNKLIKIAQCNNALVFPGIGLGILAVRASKLTKGMIWAAAKTLSESAPCRKDSALPLLPSLDDAQTVAKQIAVAVAQMAIDEKVATENIHKTLEPLIEDIFWEPRYLPYHRIFT